MKLTRKGNKGETDKDKPWCPSLLEIEKEQCLEAEKHLPSEMLQLLSHCTPMKSTLNPIKSQFFLVKIPQITIIPGEILSLPILDTLQKIEFYAG